MNKIIQLLYIPNSKSELPSLIALTDEGKLYQGTIDDDSGMMENNSQIDWLEIDSELVLKDLQ